LATLKNALLFSAMQYVVYFFSFLKDKKVKKNSMLPYGYTIPYRLSVITGQHPTD